MDIKDRVEIKSTIIKCMVNNRSKIKDPMIKELTMNTMDSEEFMLEFVRKNDIRFTDLPVKYKNNIKFLVKAVSLRPKMLNTIYYRDMNLFKALVTMLSDKKLKKNELIDEVIEAINKEKEVQKFIQANLK